MRNKDLLNFGFDDENLKGSKPNEPNIAVKIMKKSNIKKPDNKIINLEKKQKLVRLNIISSEKVETMLKKLEELNYKINRSKIYREAVENIYKQLITNNND
ncbi:hypothetical protein [Spiroplasma endosymbiont of Lariophagus distinguendus]|uniref:hypothetical protein n=1 Tax=Spiroplasma endosymbiont of Lariophagus distinguendus TaxID=2935082 RepID=UPI002079FF0C|nr:hypothetical protein [Spiroplasma endosymbiont of Lariophagus distinguendus]